MSIPIDPEDGHLTDVLHSNSRVTGATRDDRLRKARVPEERYPDRVSGMVMTGMRATLTKYVQASRPPVYGEGSLEEDTSSD